MVRSPSSIRSFGLAVVLVLVLDGCTDSGPAAAQTSALGDASVRDDGAPPGKGDGGTGSGGGGGGALGGGGGAPDGGSGRDGGAIPPKINWDASGPSTLDAACDRWADAVCKHSERCSLFNIQSNFGDVPTCITAYASECKSEAVAPGTGMNVVALNRCANYFTGSTCTDFDIPQDCAPQAGAKADGQPCMYASQCAGRHCTPSIPGLRCGICGSEPGFGEACTNDCDHGLDCIDGTCAPRPLLGMACSAQLECAGSLRCVAPGVCAPSLGLGEPCQSFNLYQCDLSQGLECNSDTQTCAPYTRLAAPGEPCGAASGSFPRTGCLAGGSCPTTTNDAGVRTCLARIKLGDPCGSSAPPSAGCASPGRCDNGICQVPDATDCE